MLKHFTPDGTLVNPQQVLKDRLRALYKYE